jgi:hypothetical protein
VDISNTPTPHFGSPVQPFLQVLESRSSLSIAMGYARKILSDHVA